MNQNASITHATILAPFFLTALTTVHTNKHKSKFYVNFKSSLPGLVQETWNWKSDRKITFLHILGNSL